MNPGRTFFPIFRIQILFIILFSILKFSREYIADRFSNEFIHIFIFSFPNLAEGVIGVLTVCLILSIFIRRTLKNHKTKPKIIYLISAILAGIYVILQELNIHQLGGKNIYDPFDIVFSVIGLSTGFILLLKLKPDIQLQNN